MMSNMDKHIIPTSEMHITHNDCKLLFDMIDKELEDKSDIVKYAQLLFLRRKVEECDKMLSNR